MRRPIFFLVLLFTCRPTQALEFRSNCNLEVFQKGDDGEPDRYLGFIREEGPHTVDVPAGKNWYVHPVGRYSQDDFAKLSQELKVKQVPGLSLSDRWDVTNETLKMLLSGRGLHILLLANTRVDNAGLLALKDLTPLEVLSLGRQISDDGLLILVSLKHLADLDLTHSRITDHGVRTLAKLTHLQSLNVTDTKITDQGAAVLGTMMSLTHLDISGTAVTDKGIQNISQLPHLEALYVGPALTDVGLKHIAQLSKLQDLDLTGTRITSGGLAPLRNLSRLKELALSGTKVGDVGLAILSPLSNLRVLELSDTQVTTNGIGQLTSLSRLETLSLSWEELTETELQMLSELKYLKTIILNGSRMPPDVLDRVRAMAQLHAKKIQQTALLVPKPAFTTPVPTPKPASVPAAPVPSLKPAAAPIAPMSIEEIKQGHSLGIQATVPVPELVPEAPAKQAIALNTTTQGSPMVLEVGVHPKTPHHVMLLTGLKRVHQVEMGGTSVEPDLAPGESSQIASPKETAANSLGEIDVNAAPARPHSQ